MTNLIRRTLRFPGTILFASTFLLASMTLPAYAEGYYRWLDSDGVVHYGSRPPVGVNAEQVNTWGKSAGENTSPATTATKNLTTKQQKVVAARQQECDDEKSRLTSLQSTGRRISMQMEDGTTRYLTTDEILKEVSTSEDFIKQACQ